MFNKDIIKISLTLKNEYSNIYKLLNEHNVKVITHNLNSLIPAFTNNIEGINTIIIDENLPEDEKKFILCHEFAHILFHDNAIRYFSKIHNNADKFELQANIFATIFTGYKYNNNFSDNYIQKIINYIYINYLKNEVSFN
ncbi:ImmA/IrrE family metallo-endopeptidase [Oceanivirga salmonicida]|uniref:ImmA/IrrE family metallo-endopeptidase n=1 Tax=Oceanivirga salmonicida TaxID=1769291 RepID=UPI00082D4FD1|nr:ImmA/IrrE family metallo-endopeptidase [Oceanivirga salmonicida]